VPFGNEVGLSQIANLYNSSLKFNDGRLAVYNCKENSGGRWVQDYERGVGGGISPYPWQTDTSIGDWFYNKHWKYQPLSWTVHMLVDITSKNGNLLLNVVLRPDGTLDPEVDTMLHQLADWTAVNGEAIYGTRPWQVFGEGSVRAKGGAFKEDFSYSAKDIRFTTKGAALYAIALGWPEENKIMIRSLAATADAAQNKIEKVELLGHAGELKFSQTTNGLAVELPGEKLSDLTCTLRITGSNFKPVPIPMIPSVVTADSHDRLIFGADDATLHGEQIKLEEQGGKPHIGYWDKADEWASWNAHIDKPGKYLVSATIASATGDGEFILEAAGDRLSAKVPKTAGWDKFATTDIGTVELKSVGDFAVAVRAKDAASWKAINLNSIRLTPQGQ